jgi:hypothetical protein
MNPRWVFFFKLCGLAIVVIALILLFPPVLEFVEMGARELRYLWWLVLLLALAVWLIWGLGKRKSSRILFYAAAWSCLRRTIGLLSPSTTGRVILM